MIPEFRQDGYLPVGIWPSTLEELRIRYCYNLFRKDLFKKLLLLIQDLKSIKCNIIYIDGSFITTTLKPNDIDVCWEENTGSNFMVEQILFPLLFDPVALKSRYGLDVFPAKFMEFSSGLLFIDFFQRIKYSNEKKGIIQINI